MLYVEPDLFVTVCNESAQELNRLERSANITSSSHLSWGVERIGACDYTKYLIDTGKQKTIVTVAVVDTGLDPTHQYFTNRTVKGQNFVNFGASTMDDHDHGTHVSGTVVDVTLELPGVRIMPVKVLDASGNGVSLNIANGVRWAVDNGTKVINMSLRAIGHVSIIDNAVAYAISKGVTVVVAAGNDTMDANGCCPAHIGEIITVSAFDSSDKPAYFTNFGTCVDVAAPGVGIRSTIRNGQTALDNGTSMASPHVAGAVAMLLIDNQSLLAADVRGLVRSSVDPIITTTGRYYGTGILNLKKLLPTCITVATVLEVNATQQLGVTVTPITANASVTWYSNNPDVATVSTSGLVTAKRAGNAIITAKTVNGLMATCNITVKRILSKLRCITCGQLIRLVQCSKCGMVYKVCECIAIKHVCRRVLLPVDKLPVVERPDVKPVIGLELDHFVQKVIAEADVNKYLNEGWMFKFQLQSGSVIMEKVIDIENITGEVLDQVNRQITDGTTQIDVENTGEVLDQVNKQITDAIAKEKQRLLEK